MDFGITLNLKKYFSACKSTYVHAWSGHSLVYHSDLYRKTLAADLLSFTLALFPRKGILRISRLITRLHRLLLRMNHFFLRRLIRTLRFFHLTNSLIRLMIFHLLLRLRYHLRPSRFSPYHRLLMRTTHRRPNRLIFLLFLAITIRSRLLNARIRFPP